MAPTSATSTRVYRSVLDYDTSEELVRALKHTSISAVNEKHYEKEEQPEDESSSSSTSDWQLSVYDPHTTAVLTVEQEAARLMNLRDYRILESEQEDAFDQVVREVQQVYNVPWAFVSIVDLGRQWFKAQVPSVEGEGSSNSENQNHGSSDGREEQIRETSRQEAFCAHTILQRNSKEIFQVPDALLDSRFCSNRLVLSGGKFRFYAGAPLVSPEGQRLGALCMLDSEPRPDGLSPSQQDKLLELAASTVDLMVQRRERLRAADEKGEEEASSSSAAARGETPSRSTSQQDAALASKDSAITSVDRVQPVAAQQQERLSPHSTALLQQRHASTSQDGIAANASKQSAFTAPKPPPLDHSPPPSPTPQGPVKKSRSLPSALDKASSSGDATLQSSTVVATTTAERRDRLPQEDEPRAILRPRPNVPLPDPKTPGVHPDEYLVQLVEAMYGVKIKVKAALELQGFFPVIQETQMAAYSIDVVSATRENNVQKLQAFYEQRGRQCLDCFNRFGEGLLNISCRRGFEHICEFLLSEPVALSVRTCDDYGRTPLHDACWNPEPQLKICTSLLQRDPSLFLVADKRGFTPFQYARPGDWRIWRDFLFQQRELLQALARPEMLVHFGE